MGSRARARHRKSRSSCRSRTSCPLPPWHRRDRQGRAGRREGRRRSRDRGPSPTTKTVVTGIEMFPQAPRPGQGRRQPRRTPASTKKEEVERGQVLCKPGTITPHTNFEASRLRAHQGRGWPSHKPFFANYRPQFYFRTTDVTGTIDALGTEMVMPGDNTEMTVTLGKPHRHGRGPHLLHPRGWPYRGFRRVVKILK